MSEIYDNDYYLNEGIPFLFNYPFSEYDMKEAGFSIIKEFNLLSESEIQKLSKMSKEKRRIEIGKLQIKNDGLKCGLKDGFRESRRRLFEYYNILPEEVISIKKDAIFVKRELSPECKVGKHLIFREKHEYTSYLRFPNKVEVYFNPIKCDIKGLGKNNEQLHHEFMSDFINQYLVKMETNTQQSVLKYLRKFTDLYKSFELPIGYYREYNERSMFSVGTEYIRDLYDITGKNINIDYNLFNIIIPMVKMTLN